MMSEQEGQGLDSGRWRHILLLLVILGVALGFRLIPIPWGIGLRWWEADYFQPDEIVITNYVASFPKSFVASPGYPYPTGVHHIDSVLFQVYKMIRATYADSPPIKWVKSRLTERQQVYLLVRTVNALMGVLSCLLVYLVLLELTKSRKHALWGAFLMNCMPYPVLNAAFATPDVPSSLITVWVFYEYVRARKRDQLDRLGYQARIGILAGCAMAVKYTNLYLLVPLTLLPLGYVLWKKRDPMRWIAGTALMLTTAFVSLLVLMPAIVFDAERVGNSIRFELDHGGARAFMAFGQLIRVFSDAFGWPVLLMALVAWAVVFAKRRRLCVEMIIFVGSFLAICGSGLLPRYLPAMAPFVAVLIGLAWHTTQGASWPSFRRFGWAFSVGAGAGIVLVVACLYGRYAYDTRIQAAKYIVAHYPEGTTLGITSVGNLRSMYMPAIRGHGYRLLDGLEAPHVVVLSERHMREMREFLRDPSFCRTGYQHFNSFWNNGPPSQAAAAFYSDMLSGRSSYRLVKEFPKTRLPLEFCGYTLYLYENTESAPIRGPDKPAVKATPTTPADKAAAEPTTAPQNKMKLVDFCSMKTLPVRWECENPSLDAKGLHFKARQKSGPGLIMHEVMLDTSTVNTVFADANLRFDNEVKPPQRLRLFWSAPANPPAPKGEWPFSESRCVTFERNSGGRFAARVKGHKAWAGTVSSAFIEATVPDALWNPNVPCEVVISSLQFSSETD